MVSSGFEVWSSSHNGGIGRCVWQLESGLLWRQPRPIDLAARDPSANRSLIAFTAWSSFAHAALMAVQAFRNLIARGELMGVAALVIIGVALIALAPGKQSGELRSAASA
jgi:hypothetical protein